MRSIHDSVAISLIAACLCAAAGCTPSASPQQTERAAEQPSPPSPAGVIPARPLPQRTVNQAAAPAKRILEVPVIQQHPELKYGCEVTSLAMLLRYAGHDVDKMTLARQVKKTANHW